MPNNASVRKVTDPVPGNDQHYEGEDINYIADLLNGTHSTDSLSAAILGNKDVDNTKLSYLKNLTEDLKTTLDNINSVLNGKQDTLGFTAENQANKGQADGYADLDHSGKLTKAIADKSQVPDLSISQITLLQAALDNIDDVLSGKADASSLNNYILSSLINSNSGVAGLNSSGLVPVGHLGSGTANSSKVLKGDGTWGDPPSPSTALSSLTDVNLTSLANRDRLLYNSSTSKWENTKVPDFYLSSRYPNGGATIFGNSQFQSWGFSDAGAAGDSYGITFPYDLYLTDFFVYTFFSNINKSQQWFIGTNAGGYVSGFPTITIGASSYGMFRDTTHVAFVAANTAIYLNNFLSGSGGSGSGLLKAVYCGVVRA